MFSIIKKEYSYDRCPDPVYFNIPLLFMYLSAIETLIRHTEIDPKYSIELIVALSWTNATIKRNL